MKNFTGYDGILSVLFEVEPLLSTKLEGGEWFQGQEISWHRLQQNNKAVCGIPLQGRTYAGTYPTVGFDIYGNLNILTTVCGVCIQYDGNKVLPLDQYALLMSPPTDPDFYLKSQRVLEKAYYIVSRLPSTSVLNAKVAKIDRECYCEVLSYIRYCLTPIQKKHFYTTEKEETQYLKNYNPNRIDNYKTHRVTQTNFEGMKLSYVYYLAWTCLMRLLK